MSGRKRLAREDWPKIAKDLGRYDIRIARDGQWFHEGRPIQRAELVKLFAGVLRCEPDGQHWLVTPVEKGRIEVEEVAFLATLAHVSDQGTDQQAITLTTNLGEAVPLDHKARLTVALQDGHPRPYVGMRDGLRARLTASVFYELVDLGEERDGHLWLASNGQWFDLGALDDPPDDPPDGPPDGPLDGPDPEQETPA